MKVEGTSATTVLMDNMGGESVTMSIAAEDMGHIMSVLTDLYEDPTAAIVREYATNALDEHLEWKVKRPIEVTLPSVMQPFLKIRDFGNGLDAEAIRTVYSQYGRSLKRDSNDVNGMLGLGSKSALTYTNQFTVVSVKDGVRVTVLVTRDEEGAGTMRILGEEPTDDPSGTEIQIAIDRHDVAAVNDAADVFFQYWEPGLVLVNGEPPHFFADDDDVLKVTDDLFIVKKTYVQDDVIVMGNVSYPYPTGATGYRDHYYVMRTPIGTVRPTPSREGLMDVALTRNTIAGLRKRVKQEIQAAVQSQVEDAPSAPEALKAALAWKRFAPEAMQCKYKGKEFPEEYVGTKRPKGDGLYDCLLHADFPNGAVYSATRVAVTAWPTTMWVTNFPLKHFTKRHMEKACIYRNEKEIEPRHIVILHDASHDADFIDPKMVVDWETLNAIPLPTAVRKSRGGGNYYSYDATTPQTSTARHYWKDVQADLIPEDTLYVRGRIALAQHWTTRLARVMEGDPFFVVSVPENRLAKFLRNFPKAREAHTVLQEELDKRMQSFSDDDVLAYTYQLHSYEPYAFELWDLDKIDDPAFKEFKAHLERDVSAITTALKTYRDIGLHHELNLPDPPNPFKPYPLIAGHRGWETGIRSHIYTYINAIYAQENA